MYRIKMLVDSDSSSGRGDSGGPVFIKDGNALALIGIISIGSKITAGPPYNTRVTDVRPFFSWIAIQ